MLWRNKEMLKDGWILFCFFVGVILALVMGKANYK